MDQVPLFPLFINLQGRKCLVIGGGETALRKTEHLLDHGADIEVIAPVFAPGFYSLRDERNRAGKAGPALICREFRRQDVRTEFALVIAATDEKKVNRMAAQICRRKRIPVNVVDDPEECTFLFPSLVKRGRLSVGVSTGGASPTAAIWLRKKIEDMIPERFGDILDWLAEIREPVIASFEQESRRKTIFRELFSECLRKGRPLTEEEKDKVLKGEGHE